MAYAFQVPRQRTKPLTQGAQLAEDQNTQGLATGNFADVQSARGATDRSNALRTSNALQATRGTFARSGVDTSPEAAARAQDQSFSAAEGQNLNGTNAVNQLQRQYRNDAMTNANQYEAAANQREQQGISNDQFDKTFGAGREDAATARNQFSLNYNAGREDANTSKTQFGETMAQRKNEFGVSSGQSQQQIDNQSKQFIQSQAQRDKEFGVTSGQSQQQINNQVDQFGRSLNQNQNQFDLTRGDSNSQFDKNLGQRQSEFGVTSGQNQQQINNQASQFGQNYQAGREDAATARNQFDLTRGDKNSQFNVTSDQNQQQINNQADQYGRTLNENQNQFYSTLNQNQNQFNSKLNQDTNQFGITSKQTQDQIDAQKSQFDLTRGDKQTAMTMDEINSIQDPVARNLALKAYYSGGNVASAIGGNIDANGQLINKSMSPGTAAYQAKVDELQATYPNKTKAEIEAMVQARSEQADAINQGVVNTGVQSVETKKALDLLKTNPTSLTPEQKNNLVASGDIKSFSTATAVPIGSAGKEMTGQMVKVGGDYYTVNNGGSVITDWNAIGSNNSHKDYTELKDSNGNLVYVVDGVLTQRRPVDAKKPSGISGVFNSFGF